jgi:hypothetical protein
VLLFPLFQPLLHALGVAYNSLTTQSIAEGTTYCNRLHNLVEQKVRFAVTADLCCGGALLFCEAACLRPDV